MPTLTTHIVLGSIASGKSTHVEQKYKSRRDATHISWHDIGCEIREKLADTMPTDSDHDMRALLNETVRLARIKFFDELGKALTQRVPTIVVDYPSFPASDWISQVAAASRAAGRDVVVEGLWVDPEIALRRRLQAFIEECPISDQADVAACLGLYREVHFPEFLHTCREMPGQFMAVASQVDRAELYDNNAERRQPRLVAKWQSGRLQGSFDPAARKAFARLSAVNPATAKFSATCNLSRGARGKVVCTLHVKTSGFYGASSEPS